MDRLTIPGEPIEGGMRRAVIVKTLRNNALHGLRLSGKCTPARVGGKTAAGRGVRLQRR